MNVKGLSENSADCYAKDATKYYNFIFTSGVPFEVGANGFIMNLKNGTYFKTALAIAVVLTILVMLCQVMRFKGFMWIGVDYLVASVLTLISSAVIKTINLGELLDVDALAYPVLNTITGIIASDIVKGVIIMAVSGVVFIVVFIVGRKLLKNKK